MGIGLGGVWVGIVSETEPLVFLCKQRQIDLNELITIANKDELQLMVNLDNRGQTTIYLINRGQTPITFLIVSAIFTFCIAMIEFYKTNYLIS
ncbi:MAG: hypothetical protein KAU21_04685 [Gammaproteobacteria bacterium]|nr:hypothetical protein [Gammaproteobacteria bacterium]